VGQRFAIASLNDGSAFAKMRDALAMDISDIGIMGAYRHWPRNFATEGLRSESVDELFFLEGGAVRCTGSLVRELLSSQSLSGAVNLKQALQRWMLPAHADQLISALDTGKLLVWIPITGPEHECTVCLSLLRNTRNAVQIHDFETDTS
jgi:hypothetical protein